MTIDERIERLTERHEALAQALEFSNHIMTERHEGLAQALELMGRELAGHMAKLADSMAHLSETVIDHERRVQNLEGGRT